MSTEFKTLYTIDSKGKLRTWRMETEGGKHRAVSGVEGGKETASGWKVCKPKNEGRANATTAEEQAEAEVLALYKKKLENKYYLEKDKAAGKKFFGAMLAHKYDSKSANDRKLADYAFCQPKLDGMRCIVTKDGMMSRNGKAIVSSPHIMDDLADFFRLYPDYTLDGELYNHELKANFDKIMSLARKTKPTQADLDESAKLIEYHVYDLPGDEHFSERHFKLSSFFKSGVFGKRIRYVETYLTKSSDEFDSHYAQFLQDGYEGTMLRLDVGYVSGRTSALLKRKEFLEEEFPVVRVEEGAGNWAGYAKRVVARLPDGRTFEAGMRGTQDFAKKLLNGPTPKEATIRYQNLTPDGIPRFGVAVAFWENGRDV